MSWSTNPICALNCVYALEGIELKSRRMAEARVGGGWVEIENFGHADLAELFFEIFSSRNTNSRFKP